MTTAMVLDLLSDADRARARAFLAAQGLAFEPAFDDLVGVFEGGALVAVGARERDVLKMLAVDPAEQGGGLLGSLVTELARRGLAAGHEGLFVFTKPEYATSFEALGFELLASHGRAALLEYGHGLARWLAANGGEVRGGTNGAVVVNCNPFTLGHRHLIEEAARRVEALYVFVVREDRSAFPFELRRRLVREGTSDLGNVRVLDTSRYAVSAVTFPSYFLKRSDDVAAIQLELDLILFGRRIAPFFHVTRRFFGAEPYCATTRAYNAAMHRILPSFGIEAIELERKSVRGEAISASAVRAALRAGDKARVEELVPANVAAFLRSDESRDVREGLRNGDGRHG
jgi:[citrate (pro-3S)-lyase] ligase